MKKKLLITFLIIICILFASCGESIEEMMNQAVEHFENQEYQSYNSYYEKIKEKDELELDNLNSIIAAKPIFYISIYESQTIEELDLSILNLESLRDRIPQHEKNINEIVLLLEKLQEDKEVEEYKEAVVSLLNDDVTILIGAYQISNLSNEFFTLLDVDDEVGIIIENLGALIGELDSLATQFEIIIAPEEYKDFQQIFIDTLYEYKSAATELLNFYTTNRINVSVKVTSLYSGNLYAVVGLEEIRNEMDIKENAVKQAMELLKNKTDSFYVMLEEESQE